jgi:DNA polymerase III subunit alpha
MNIIFLDLETTGLPKTINYFCYHDPKYINYYDSSRITEIGYYITNNLGDELKKFSSLIKPTNFIIKEIRNKKGNLLNDITHNNAIKYGRNINDIFSEMLLDIKKCDMFIAHNVKFDYNVLMSECYRYKNYNMIKYLKKLKITCTQKLSGNRSLLLSYQKLFGYKPDEKHRALYDASLCKSIYFKLFDIHVIKTLYMRQINKIYILLLEIILLIKKYNAI